MILSYVKQHVIILGKMENGWFRRCLKKVNQCGHAENKDRREMVFENLSIPRNKRTKLTK